MALNAVRVARQITNIQKTLARLEKYVTEASGEAPAKGPRKPKVEKVAAKGKKAPAAGKRGPKAAAEKPAKVVKKAPVGKKAVKAAPAKKGKKSSSDEDFPSY
jgi:hypothetical protein